MFRIDFKSYPISINMIMPCIGLCSCNGIIQTVHALALNTPIAPSDETMRVFCLLHLLAKVDFPPFIDDFHLETKVTSNQKNIYLYFGLFTTFFFRWPLKYGVWTFTKLFCPKWLYEWLQPLFLNIWAHCSRSCSTFTIAFTFTSQFLALEKKSISIHPIAINEVTYRLITHTLSIQFKYILVEHFNPH